jgi:cell division protein FtsL
MTVGERVLVGVTVWTAASAAIAPVIGRILRRNRELDERLQQAIRERDKARDEYLRHIREKAGERDA